MVYLKKQFIVGSMLIAGVLFAFGISFFLTDAAYGSRAEKAPVITGQNTGAGHLSYITGILKERRTGLDIEQERTLAAVIVEQSRANSVDPLLVMAIIETESTYYNRARSNKGAIGLMQIMPATGVWVAGLLDIDWHGKQSLYDPVTNIKLGTGYFSMLRSRFDNNTHASLAAYNAGPTRVSAHLRRGQSPPAVYADKVLKSYKELKEDFLNVIQPV